MRWLLAVALFVLALGTVRVVGCGETTGTGGNGGSAGDGGSGGVGGGGASGELPECETPGDCDDGEKCTTDECAEGACEYTPVEDGIACDEANECTVGQCAGGACEVTPAEDGTACDEANECTVGQCAGGACEVTPVANGTACGDGAGTCQNASCQVACTERGIRDAIAVGGGPYTFDCGGSTKVVTQGTIEIDNDVTLDGRGALIVDGNDQHRVFWVVEEVTAELRGLTISGGWLGGVANRGALTVMDCTISGNSGHGGITNEREGVLTIERSTVSGNSGIEEGAGVNNWGGTTTLLNSTVSGNVVVPAGGGGTGGAGAFVYQDMVLSVGGTLRLVQSTVLGTIYGEGGTIASGATIVVGGCRANVDMEWVSEGHNITRCWEFSRDGDRDVSPDELSLGPLQDNGGPTETHALGTGSAAIDVIPEARCQVDTDQRGFPRDSTCDVGAFEVQP